MSSPQYSQSHRYLLKAREAQRLMGAREYEAAITACNEAIELVPGTVGAYRTRAEAYQRLGMSEEAEADLEHLAQISDLVQGHPEEPTFWTTL